jgi:hypothetical protein
MTFVQGHLWWEPGTAKRSALCPNWSLTPPSCLPTSLSLGSKKNCTTEFFNIKDDILVQLYSVLPGRAGPALELAVHS